MKLFDINDVKLELEDVFDTIKYTSDNDAWLTKKFKQSSPLIKHFDYDLSSLDKKDLTKFIQIALEPELTSLLQKLYTSNLYINRKLFHATIEKFTTFVPSCDGTIASDWRNVGYIGFTKIQLCEKNFFNNEFILFSTENGADFNTFISGVIKN